MDPIQTPDDAGREKFEHDDLEARLKSFGERLEAEDGEPEGERDKPPPATLEESPPAEDPEPNVSVAEPEPEPKASPEPESVPSQGAAAVPESEGEALSPFPFDTKIRYKHNREEKEDDLADYLKDPEKYGQLVDRWQKGVDYDRQRELADKARADAAAATQQVQQMQNWMQQQGIIERDPVTGQWVRAQQKPQHAPPQQQPQQSADEQRLAALHEKVQTQGLSPQEWRELSSLEVKREVGKFRSEWQQQQAEQQRQMQQQQQQAQQQQQIQRLLENAKSQVDSRHGNLKALYTHPVTGQVDEFAHTRAHKIAWATIQGGGTLRDALNAMDIDARAYHTNAQQILAQMKGTRQRRTPSPAPSGNGTPAAKPEAAKRPVIDLDAPPGKDGLAESWARWEREAAASGGGE